MKDHLIQTWRIPEQGIILEENGLTTWRNAVEVIKLAKQNAWDKTHH